MCLPHMPACLRSAKSTMQVADGMFTGWRVTLLDASAQTPIPAPAGASLELQVEDLSCCHVWVGASCDRVPMQENQQLEVMACILSSQAACLHA